MLRVYKSLKYLSHVSNNLNEYTLYAVEDASHHMQSSKPTEVQLHVDGQPLSMEVDIGHLCQNLHSIVCGQTGNYNLQQYNYR